jgi:hypothetical protein
MPNSFAVSYVSIGSILSIDFLIFRSGSIVSILFAPRLHQSFELGGGFVLSREEV